MEKVAKLVSIILITRVIVNKDATDEEIMEEARPNFITKVHDESLGENIEAIREDTECPYSEDDELPK